MHKKGSRADTGTSEKKQVLGTAEGGQHGAADGGDILHGDHGKDIVFLSPGPEQQNGQGDEDDEGNVIGDKHGGKEHRKHQKQGKPHHGADPAGKPDQRQKNILLLEALQHREHHEEHGKGMPIDLSQKRGAGGRDQQGNQRRQQRNRQHQIFFEQFRNFFHTGYLSGSSFGSIAPFSLKGKIMFPFCHICHGARMPGSVIPSRTAPGNWDKNQPCTVSQREGRRAFISGFTPDSVRRSRQGDFPFLFPPQPWCGPGWTGTP